MPLEIHYGAWIDGSDGNQEILVKLSQDQVVRFLEGEIKTKTVAEALRSLLSYVVEQVRMR